MTCSAHAQQVARVGRTPSLSCYDCSKRWGFSGGLVNTTQNRRASACASLQTGQTATSGQIPSRRLSGAPGENQGSKLPETVPVLSYRPPVRLAQRRVDGGTERAAGPLAALPLRGSCIPPGPALLPEAPLTFEGLLHPREPPGPGQLALKLASRPPLRAEGQAC